MIEWMEGIDRQLFLWLNSQHAPWLDQPMYLISKEWFWTPVYLLLLLAVQRAWGWKGLLYVVLAVAIVITICDRTSVELFKNIFKRYRPTRNVEIGHLVHTVNDYRGGLYGFLSSHAANYFGICTLLYHVLKAHFPKGAPWLFAWAALIAYSRIYLGVHYPADIIAGALLGFLVGFLVYKLLNRIILQRK